MIARRIRAALALGAVWAPFWAFVGLAMQLRGGEMHNLRILALVLRDSTRVMLTWGLAGFVIGLVFAMITSALARGRPFHRLPGAVVAILTGAFAFLLGCLLDRQYESGVILGVLAISTAYVSLRFAALDDGSPSRVIEPVA